MNNTPGGRGGFVDIARTFLKIGALSYGGPAVLGIMQTEILERLRWMTRERFLEALGLVHMLPGPAGIQMAIVIGHEREGWRGGVLAGLCFMLPGFIVLMSLTYLYSSYGELGTARSAFYGLAPVVLGIFAVAVWKLGRTALNAPSQVVLALACAALAGFAPIGVATLLLLAGCAGVAINQSRRWGLSAGAIVLAASLLAQRVIGPATGLSITPGNPPDVWELGLFFVKVGSLTFGGALAIVAFVQEQVVNQYGWLTAQEFLDGLALGQLTPGPMLLLAAYVGYKASGWGAATVSACAIFLPSFVLVLVLLPVLARFKDVLWLKAAIRGVTSAVIGVLVVSLSRLAPHAIPDVYAAVLLAAAIAVMVFTRIGPFSLMGAGALAGIALRTLHT